MLFAAGASPAFPANVFSLTLSERRKLGKGVRRAPVAYTMSGDLQNRHRLGHFLQHPWLWNCSVLL